MVHTVSINCILTAVMWYRLQVVHTHSRSSGGKVNNHNNYNNKKKVTVDWVHDVQQSKRLFGKEKSR